MIPGFAEQIARFDQALRRRTPGTRRALQLGEMIVMGSFTLLLVTLVLAFALAVASGRLLLGGILRLMERAAVPSTGSQPTLTTQTVQS